MKNWAELALKVSNGEALTKEEQKFYDNPSGESSGLGDTIKKITDKLGIPQCGGCKERQKILNRWMPYKKDDKVKE